MRLKNCYRTRDFRQLARQRLPSAIFHYIDGGADDEVTLIREVSVPWGMNFLKLEGVALVTGLDRTGSDPSPSALRTALVKLS